MNVLHLDSSILGDASASRQLTRSVVDGLRAAEPEINVVHRDLGSTPIDHLTPEVLATRGTPAELLNVVQMRESRLDAELLRELEWADTLVIGAPLYNFTIPTGLKAWIDRITVAGKTFRYTDKGPEGLLRGKRAIVVATSGGVHGDSPVDTMHVGYLKTLLGFVGITDVEVVRAEGLGMGPEVRAQAMAGARARIASMFIAQAA
jgi:FMN-dependent NADH-azoreductase